MSNEIGVKEPKHSPQNPPGAAAPPESGSTCRMHDKGWLEGWVRHGRMLRGASHPDRRDDSFRYIAGRVGKWLFEHRCTARLSCWHVSHDADDSQREEIDPKMAEFRKEEL